LIRGTEAGKSVTEFLFDPSLDRLSDA